MKKALWVLVRTEYVLGPVEGFNEASYIEAIFQRKPNLKTISKYVPDIVEEGRKQLLKEGAYDKGDISGYGTTHSLKPRFLDE